MKPWHEGDKLWVSWTQTFKMNVTKELLKKIIFYKITLRIWDTTDKVSKKVRYYRVKTDGHSEEAGSFGKSSIWVLFAVFLGLWPLTRNSRKARVPSISRPWARRGFWVGGTSSFRDARALGLRAVSAHARWPPPPPLLALGRSCPWRCQHRHAPQARLCG